MPTQVSSAIDFWIKTRLTIYLSNLDKNLGDYDHWYVIIQYIGCRYQHIANRPW